METVFSKWEWLHVGFGALLKSSWSPVGPNRSLAVAKIRRETPTFATELCGENPRTLSGKTGVSQKSGICAANHPRGRATPAYSGFRKNTTRCVSSNPKAVWSAWLAEFSSSASEPNSTHPSDFPQSATALQSNRAIPFRLSTGRT